MLCCVDAVFRTTQQKKTFAGPRLVRQEQLSVVACPEHVSHRLWVVFKHLPGLLLGAPLLHALPLQVSLLGLLENLIGSLVSDQELVRLLRGQ